MVFVNVFFCFVLYASGRVNRGCCGDLRRFPALLRNQEERGARGKKCKVNTASTSSHRAHIRRQQPTQYHWDCCIMVWLAFISGHYGIYLSLELARFSVHMFSGSAWYIAWACTKTFATYMYMSDPFGSARRSNSSM